MMHDVGSICEALGERSCQNSYFRVLTRFLIRGAFVEYYLQGGPE